MADTVPIKLASERKIEVTADEVQGWVDTLSERDSGFLRIIMEGIQLRSRADALKDAIDTALVGQQMTKPKTGAREIATKIVSALMQGRMKCLEEMRVKGFG